MICSHDCGLDKEFNAVVDELADPAGEHRLDVLRTPSLEIQLSAAIGQQITSAKVSKRNPLVVELALADGTTMHLLKQPDSPPPSSRTRTNRSVR